MSPSMTTRLNADLAVTPAEDRAIAAAARRAGLSKRGWLTQVVRDRIDRTDDTARIEHLIDRLDTETRARAAATTEQTLSVIRTEAQRLTDEVIAAMQHSAPAASPSPSSGAPDKSTTWGDLVHILGRLGTDININQRPDASRLTNAVKLAALVREDVRLFTGPLMQVHTKFLELEKTTQEQGVADPGLEHLFDLIRTFIPTTRSHP